jgi:hypothetical protein
MSKAAAAAVEMALRRFIMSPVSVLHIGT